VVRQAARHRRTDRHDAPTSTWTRDPARFVSRVRQLQLGLFPFVLAENRDGVRGEAETSRLVGLRRTEFWLAPALDELPVDVTDARIQGKQLLPHGASDSRRLVP